MLEPTEDLEARLSSLIPEKPPANEEERLAIQARLEEISQEFTEIAEVVEALTQAILESYGLSEADLDELPPPDG